MDPDEDAEAKAGADLDDFKKAIMKSGEPRYAYVDVPYNHPQSGAATSKAIAVFFCDDNCGVKPKMLYASTKDSFSKKIGVTTVCQANEADELNKDVLEEFAKTKG